MDRQPRNLGRAYLVKKLRERGLSRRDAVRILNTIFVEMSKALKRGWEVEFPFGKLKRVKRYFGARGEAVDDWPANRQPYTVEWELDAADEEL
jgi:Bacterial DNA-binding protein